MTPLKSCSEIPSFCRVSSFISIRCTTISNTDKDIFFGNISTSRMKNIKNTFFNQKHVQEINVLKSFSLLNYKHLIDIIYICNTQSSSKNAFRNSHQRCSMKTVVLRNFAKFTEKHLCQTLLFNKVAGLRPATLLKRKFFAKF